MDKVFKIFKQLQATNSKLNKMEILKENSDYILYVKTLKWLLNPYILTGINEKKLHKEIPSPNQHIATWEQVMEYLSEHFTGKDEDIGLIQDFISRQPEEHRSWYEQLVTKSLKLGVDAKTVNSVYGKDFIPTFNVMLANKYFEHPKVVEGKEFTITEKIDGFRLALHGIGCGGNTEPKILVNEN
jgi:DNA ligase-1